MRRYTVDSVLFTQPRKRKHNKKNAASPSSSPSPRQLGASSTIWLYNVSLATRSWVKQCSAQANIGSALTSLLEDNPGSQTEIHHLNTPCLLHVIKAWQSETKTQGCQKIQTKTDMEVLFIVFFFSPANCSLIPLPGVPVCRVHVSRFSPSLVNEINPKKCILYQNNHHCFALTLYRDDVISTPSVWNHTFSY